MLQGAPFNIKDFKVLLDKQVYEGLEGRWVDLFNRMKWDIIKSVLKSVAGLQGRKFKVKHVHATDVRVCILIPSVWATADLPRPQLFHCCLNAQSR